jgi:hypothetical protein
MAALFGLIFNYVGLTMKSEETAKTDLNVPISNASSSNQIEFRIHDLLGANQISEQITIIIDGKNVGNLTVNEQYPSSNLLVNVSQTGQHSYTLETHSIFNVDGTQQEFVGAGQGMINVENGKNFDLIGSIAGTNWILSMVEREN